MNDNHLSYDEKEERMELIRECLWVFFRPYIIKVTIWVVVVSIGSLAAVAAASAWCYAVRADINSLVDKAKAEDVAREGRITEWRAWRNDVDAHFRGVDGRTYDRWTRTSMRDYSAQLGWLNPALKTPDVDIIAARQTAP